MYNISKYKTQVGEPNKNRYNKINKRRFNNYNYSYIIAKTQPNILLSILISKLA